MTAGAGVTGPGLAAAVDGWVSPRSGQALAWDAGRTVLATATGDERFGCLAADIPDFRDGSPGLDAAEVASVRRRLDEWWRRTEAEPPAPPGLVPGSAADGRRFWRRTARVEALAYLRWCLRGRPRYTQRDSMERYRTVTDVYPNAERRRVTVLTGDRVATAPLMTFKRLTLEPMLGLIDRADVRSVLDFGCGWGANTIALRQLRPALTVWSFDLSPQRVLATGFNLERLGLAPHRLFVADGCRLPLPDGAVDLVLSTHVLEQMAEVLDLALAEIRRVARRFAWHVEPTYRFARWAHRLRMRRLGYPRDIGGRAARLGWTVLEHRLASPAWGATPGELIVLRK